MTDSTKTVAITGAAGALGRYAVLHFRHRRGYRVLEADRTVFRDRAKLRDLVRDVDAVLHLAGVNRAADAETRSANPDIARTLVTALEEAGATPHVLYASTIHERGDSIYGTSKREAGDILERWADGSGARFTRLRLPHIYSELVRAHYNSGIATFCHLIATGGQPEIDVDAEIHPLHASEVCALLDALLDGGEADTAPLGAPWHMSDILEAIAEMHALYMGELIVPDLREARRLHLFNSYRAHLYPQGFPVHPALHADERGNLFEAMRELNGGQSFISTTAPGITRGNHFHFHKVERFCVLRGEARIDMRPMGGRDTLSFSVSGERPCYVDMPTLWTHNITNTGQDELLTLFWTHEIFDPDAPDTYFAEV